MPLTQEQLDAFERDGCIAVEDYLPQATVASLNEEIAKLLQRVDLESHPLTRFTTAEDDDKHVGDDYFINSADKVRYFFEVDAFNEQGELTKPVEKAINKIGHGLHFLNEKFNQVTVNSDVSQICRQLGFTDPRALQSMVIVKQPEIGGKVPSHQDGEFLYTEPQSCIGFWIALENCTLANGCLSFIPGSHKTFGIDKRFVKDFAKGGTKFVDPKTMKDYDPALYEDDNARRNDESLFRPVEIPAGTLVLIHNRVVHKSERNQSPYSRNAYTFHVVEGNSHYDNRNWLQVPPESGTGGTMGFTKL